MSEMPRTIASRSFLPRDLQQVLQLEADVEVVFDGGLAAAGHDDDVLNARVHRLLHPVLDDGLVHDRQHLLGLRLGGGKESRAQPRGGENGFANFGRHLLQFGAAGTPGIRQRGRRFDCVSPSRCAIYMYLGKQQQWHT